MLTAEHREGHGRRADGHHLDVERPQFFAGTKFSGCRILPGLEILVDVVEGLLDGGLVTIEQPPQAEKTVSCSALKKARSHFQVY